MFLSFIVNYYFVVFFFEFLRKSQKKHCVLFGYFPRIQQNFVAPKLVKVFQSDISFKSLFYACSIVISDKIIGKIYKIEKYDSLWSIHLFRKV